MLTAAQTNLFENECAAPVHSPVAAFVAIFRVVVAGLKTRSILWLAGEQRERK